MAQTTVLNNVRPLPPGWQQCWNPDMNKWYYVLTTTVPPTISFEHPLDLLPSPASPPPYPHAESPLVKQRKPSIGSISPGVSSLGSPATSSPRGSALMTVERISTTAEGRITPAQSIAQAHRSTSLPLNPMLQAQHSPIHSGTLPPEPMSHNSTMSQGHVSPPYPAIHANTLPGFSMNQRPPVVQTHVMAAPVARPPIVGQAHVPQLPPGAAFAKNPMVNMPEPRPLVNPSGMYGKLPGTAPLSVAPSNASMLSISTTSTNTTGTSHIPLNAKAKKEKGKKEKKEKKEKEKKEKEKKVKKAKDPNKTSFWGTSAMEDLRNEAMAAEAAATLQPGGIGAPMTRMGLANQLNAVNMGMSFGLGGQVQMGVTVPGQVQALQQNGGLGVGVGVPGGMVGMQNVATIGQINPQAANMMAQNYSQAYPPGVIDLSKVGSSMAKATKNFFAGALYMTTGLSAQDFAKLRSRMTIAFSGVPLGEIGIDARQLEDVLSGQPRANYQGVINALMIQQQREQIRVLQTGKPIRNVNYQELIAQVEKMKNVANNRLQQQIAMNTGAQGMAVNGVQMNMGGMQMGAGGMQMGVQNQAGMMGQANVTQQSAILQQQIIQQQQKLQQMQAAMGQPGLMMNQGMMQPMAMQMQGTGVVASPANPMMRAGVTGPTTPRKKGKKGQQTMGLSAVGVQVTKKSKKGQQTVGLSAVGTQMTKKSKKGQQTVGPSAVGAQTTKKSKKGNNKPLPVAPEGKKKTQKELPVPRAGKEKKKAAGASATHSTMTMQTMARPKQGAEVRGRKPQRGAPRGGRPSQLQRLRGQPGQGVISQGVDQQTGGDDQGYNSYLVTAQQEDDGDEDEDEDDEDEDEDEGDEDEDEGDEDKDEGDEDEDDGDEDEDNEDEDNEDEDDEDEDDEDEDEDEADAGEDENEDEDGSEQDEQENDDEEDEDDEDDEVDTTLYPVSDPCLDPCLQGDQVAVYDPSQVYSVAPVDDGQQFDFGDVSGGFDASGDNSGGNNGGYDLSASFGDMNLDSSFGDS